MLHLMADENINDDIVRGLLLRQPNFDIVCARDVGLGGAEDPDVLAWAAENDRILLTFDRAAMADHAYERVVSGEVMPGLFILNDRFPVGRAIDEILLMAECSEQHEWSSRVVHIPL